MSESSQRIVRAICAGLGQRSCAAFGTELAPRPVLVHRIEVVRYDYPELTLDIECGSGTYVRSLVRDLGEADAVPGVGDQCGGLPQFQVRHERLVDESEHTAVLDVEPPAPLRAAWDAR